MLPCCAWIFILLVLQLRIGKHGIWANHSSTVQTGVFFIFGDSLADVGNNNYIVFSFFKANFFPNGIDFPGNLATGRSCNGRLVLDELATTLGYPISLPCLSPLISRSMIASGVNYASNGCGILNETSNNSSGCLSLWTQLNYHEKTVKSLVRELAIDKAQELLHSSVYFLLIGSNDYLGYFLKNKTTYSPAEFNRILVAHLSDHLRRLYSLSARKLVVFGVGPLGCIPKERANNEDGACNNELNDWVLSFNQALRSLIINDLNTALPDVKITFVDSYMILIDMMHNPQKYGLKVATEACCGGGRLRAQVSCLPLSLNYCTSRDTYLYWDAWHPTQEANVQLAKYLLSTHSEIVYPWTIQQLINGSMLL